MTDEMNENGDSTSSIALTTHDNALILVPPTLESVFCISTYNEQSILDDMFLFMFLQYFDSLSLVQMCQVNKTWAFVIETLRDSLQIIHRYHTLYVECCSDNSIIQREILSGICRINDRVTVEYWIPANHHYPHDLQRVSIHYITKPKQKMSGGISIYKCDNSCNIAFRAKNNPPVRLYDDDHDSVDISILSKCIEGRKLIRDKWKLVLSKFVAQDLLTPDCRAYSELVDYPCCKLLNKLFKKNTFKLAVHRPNHLSEMFIKELEIFGIKFMSIEKRKKLIEKLVEITVMPRVTQTTSFNGQYAVTSSDCQSWENGIIWDTNTLDYPLDSKHGDGKFFAPKVTVRNGTDIVIEFWVYFQNVPQSLLAECFVRYERVEMVLASNGRLSLQRGLDNIEPNLSIFAIKAFNFITEAIGSCWSIVPTGFA
jgi:hypothetical protein